jgi:hypothetical protein
MLYTALIALDLKRLADCKGLEGICFCEWNLVSGHSPMSFGVLAYYDPAVAGILPRIPCLHSGLPSAKVVLVQPQNANWGLRLGFGVVWIFAAESSCSPACNLATKPGQNR